MSEYSSHSQTPLSITLFIGLSLALVFALSLSPRIPVLLPTLAKSIISKSDKSAGSMINKMRRKRREDHNARVVALDAALPPAVRKRLFKGAGPRAKGTDGRSFFSVLSDAIGYLRLLRLATAQLRCERA